MEAEHQLADIVRRLADSLRPLATRGQPDGSSSGGAFADGGSLSAGPDATPATVPRLLETHRAFVRRLLTPPGHASLDRTMSEVRLPADYGLYLRLLFPRAEFLFLLRHPGDGYLAYRSRPTRFARWPRSQLRAPYAYGHAWRRLAESLVLHVDALDATLIRYEDLLDGGDGLDRLEELLGGAADRSVLRTVPQHPVEAGPISTASALELSVLLRAAQPAATALGYTTSRTRAS